MAIKKEIKLSEARILVFLSNAEPRFWFAQMISVKLNMDYGYLRHQLAAMVNKEWVVANRRQSRVYYSNTKNAPLEQAKEVITQEACKPKKKKIEDVEEE